MTHIISILKNKKKLEFVKKAKKTQLKKEKKTQKMKSLAKQSFVLSIKNSN